MHNNLKAKNYERKTISCLERYYDEIINSGIDFSEIESLNKELMVAETLTLPLATVMAAQRDTRKICDAMVGVIEAIVQEKSVNV
jgi:hypothetical protein